MILVTEQQVRELLPMREAIRLMRETFAALREGAAINQPRRRLHLPTGSTLHGLAGAWGKYFGTKIYSTNPKYGAHFFLLNGFAMKAWPGDRATAQKTYLSSLADLGYPDFAT